MVETSHMRSGGGVIWPPGTLPPIFKSIFSHTRAYPWQQWGHHLSNPRSHIAIRVHLLSVVPIVVL